MQILRIRRVLDDDSLGLQKGASVFDFLVLLFYFPGLGLGLINECVS